MVIGCSSHRQGRVCLRDRRAPPARPDGGLRLVYLRAGRCRFRHVARVRYPAGGAPGRASAEGGEGSSRSEPQARGETRKRRQRQPRPGEGSFDPATATVRLAPPRAAETWPVKRGHRGELQGECPAPQRLKDCVPLGLPCRVTSLKRLPLCCLSWQRRASEYAAQ